MATPKDKYFSCPTDFVVVGGAGPGAGPGALVVGGEAATIAGKACAASVSTALPPTLVLMTTFEVAA